jgi:hypothetical protein
LDLARGLVEVLVIDSVEQPTPNLSSQNRIQGRESSRSVSFLPKEPIVRTAAVALCFALLVTTIASGQTVTPQVSNKGALKIWTGASLLVAGLIAVPITIVPNDRYDPPAWSVGVMSAGGALIWWGVNDRRKATRPNTTLGVTIGHKRALQIRRSW